MKEYKVLGFCMILFVYKVFMNVLMLVLSIIFIGILVFIKVFSILICDRFLNNKNVDYMCKYMYMKN